jgi:MEMO1 family protein
MSAMPTRHVVTADKYDLMIDAGVFADERVELMLGEIVDMSPIGSAHQACVDRLNHLFAPVAVHGDAILRIQGTVRLSDVSQPQPDIALLKPRDDFYADGHPTPDDILLVVEVADTSARYDRWTKMPAYATAGVAEAWVVDLNAGLVDIAGDPGPGGYGRLVQASPGRVLRPGALPTLEVPVDKVLGINR